MQPHFVVPWPITHPNTILAQTDLPPRLIPCDGSAALRSLITAESAKPVAIARNGAPTHGYDNPAPSRDM